MNDASDSLHRGEQAAPMSYAQQRLWLLDRLMPMGSVYNNEQTLRLSGELDHAALRSALNELVRRHEVLRTRFAMRGGQPVQIIAPESSIALPIEDLQEYAPVERAHEARRRAMAAVEAAFDLSRGPLIRARLFRLAPDEHWLQLVLHHIVTDGWSSGVLARELTALYAARHRGEASPLAALPVQYADYAVWQRQWLQGKVLAQQMAYWRQALQALPVLDLPADRPRPALASYRGGHVRFEIPESLTGSLKRLGRGEGATLFMLLLAAYQILLHRYSGQEDIAVGVPVAGRSRPQLEGLIGFFVNTLVLRGDLSGNPSFRRFLLQVRDRALDAFSHQDLPFEKLVEELAPKRDLSRNPLFQASLVLQNTPPGHWALPGLDVQRLEGIHARAAKFDLIMSLVERGGTLAGRIEYATDLFDAATIERMAAQFVRLLHAIVADPECRIDELPLLTAAERHRMLVEWNDTAADYPKHRCIHELFEEQAARRPDAVAVVFEDTHLTYCELDARADRLAHHLQSLGVGPDVLVGLCVERSVEMVVALVGILKAGGAYVALDPRYPEERQRFILKDTGLAVLLTQRSLAGRLPVGGCTVILVDAPLPDARPGGPVRLTAPNHLAYVIYTSGSTGVPKGVAIEHHCTVSFLHWVRAAFSDEELAGMLCSTSVCFDLSVFELFGTLCWGGKAILVENALNLGSCRNRQEVTLVNTVPSVMQALLESQGLPDSVITVNLAGEPLRESLVDALYESPHVRRVNDLYGPTETTTYSTWALRARHQPATIGRPIANTHVYLLDARLNPVPIGVTGEVCIGGEGVARGYLNRPELTAQRFIPDPFRCEPGARVYRTGDLARYRPDGSIELLGRADRQIKWNGFRIELGEIEAALTQHPQVREAAVIVREDVPGDRRLVAYAVAREGGLAVADLRALVKRQLPHYMTPAAFVILPALPLTANGKVDRSALPAPDAAACAIRVYEGPVGDTETTLAQIWADVLKLGRVGRHDHFFELGGHSLLAVHVIERMRQAGLHADVRTLFVTPTLAELATAVGSDVRDGEIPPNRIPDGCDAITPEMLPLVNLTAAEIERLAGAVPGGAANIQDIYPLAPLQEGILFHHVMTTDGDPYLLSALFSFDSRPRLDGYLRSLQAVIDRHDILRTAVMWEGLPEPVQVVWRHAPLPVEEVSIATAGDVARQLRARFDPRHYRLDVRRAPLIHIFIAHDAANTRWVMLQLSHHLSTDHISLEVVQQEIRAHLSGQAGRLPVPLPFRNFIAQTRLGVSRDEHQAFFRKMLADVDEPTIPFGLADVRGDGADIAEARHRVDASLAKRLRECARTQGVSVASVCHLAWALVLARVSGRDDVVFGTVLFGRMHRGSGIDRVLGLFINTLPVRIRVGDAGVRDSVRHTHKLLGQLLRHEHASLALAQRCSAVAAPAPLFSALLNYRYNVAATRAAPAARDTWDGIECLRREDRTNYPLTLSVDDLGEGFALKVQVQSPIDPQRVCAFMHCALAQLVGALESAPATPLCALDVLPASERRQLLVDWNDTTTDYPRDQCIQQLFERQAERAPDAVAVVLGDARLSYRELDARANQLAHRLRSLGVGPEVLVAICVERSLELVIGLLGILKAGGAYVPLDPELPDERLAFMLDDAAVSTIVTREALLERLPRLATTLCLDRDRAAIDAHPATAPPLATDVSHLAYVMYTSGSTGTPKGVMVTHGNVARLFSATRHWFRFDASDVWTYFHSCAFDFSVWEMWGALTHGGRLVMVPHLVSRDPDAFHALLRHEGVTVLNQTPSAFRQLAAADARVEAPSGLRLRLVILGGEALEIQSLRSWLERHGDTAPQLVNMYGITETTVHVTYRPVRRADLDGAPGCMIGARIPDLRVYVLDRHLQPVPVGVAGEIVVGGAGVARGYLNRPGLTAERFVADPFSADAEARLYRSGDLARHTPAGDLEYLGRIDQQVKLRGFRIEPGEIEAALARHPEVREAVVVLRLDAPGNPRLVAYVVARREGLAANDLRAWLKRQLPEYMVPAAFVLLPALPLTPNGKVNRKDLPASADETVAPPQERPRTPIESEIAAIWADLLRLPHVDVDDDFFNLGGHSMLAVQLMNRINESLHVDLTLRQLFASPTVRALALAALDRMVAGFDQDPPPRQPEAVR